MGEASLGLTLAALVTPAMPERQSASDGTDRQSQHTDHSRFRSIIVMLVFVSVSTPIRSRRSYRHRTEKDKR